MRAQLRWPVLGVILALALLLTGCATNKAFREKQARAFRDRGERYLGANQSSKALEQFFEALKIYPDDPYLHYDMAYAYDVKGMLDKTEYHLKEAASVERDSNCLSFSKAVPAERSHPGIRRRRISGIQTKAIL